MQKQLNTFLIEKIIVLFFFAIAVTIALNFFVSAHNLSTLNIQRSKSINIVQSLDEEIRSDYHTFLEKYKANIQNENNSKILTLHYDKDFSIVNSESDYTLTLAIIESNKLTGKLLEVNTSMHSKSELLAQIGDKIYIE